MVARQRRKLVSDKAKNREKYPLAAARVIVEFKLRRAKKKQSGAPLNRTLKSSCVLSLWAAVKSCPVKCNKS